MAFARAVPLVLFGLLLLEIGVGAQSIRTQNSTMVLEVAGATLTLAPVGSCAVQSTDTVLLSTDLQAALVAGIAGASNTQFSSQISAVGTSASGATAQLVGLSSANAALSDAVNTQLSSLVASLSAASTTNAQVSTRAAQMATSIDQQTSTSLMGLGSLIAAQLLITQTQLSTQVQAEVLRASAAEAALANALATQASQTLATANVLVSSMVAQLQDETSALRADNSALRQQLLVEVSRATQTELIVATSVATGALTADSNLVSAQNRQFLNFTTGISTESSRAVGTEITLNTSLLTSVSIATVTASVGRVSLGNTVSGAIATEVSRAITAETAINTLVLGIGAPFATLPLVTGTLWSWHDGSDINSNGQNIPTATTNLATWFDKGPNGIHMDTRTVGAATDVTFVPNVRNGRGAVFFNGNTFLTSSRTASLGGSITWFLVYRTSPTATTARSLATITPVSAPYANWYMSSGGTTERWEAGTGPSSDEFSTLTLNTWVVSVGRTSTTVGRRHRCSLVANEFVSNTAVPSTTAAKGLNFASYAGAYHNNFFAESLIFNNYLSDADTLAVFNWLRAKWAI